MKVNDQMLLFRLMACLGMCCLARSSARSETLTVDVYEWSRTGTGTTDSGWEVFGIDDYSDKGVRLNKEEEYVRSPVFEFCITQLVLTVRSSSDTTERFLTAVPLVADSSAACLAARATTAYEEQTFAWPATAAVRQFQLQNLGSGPAGWGIRSCTLFFDRLPAPEQLTADCRYSNAVTLSWTPDSQAVGHEFELYRVQTVPPHFTLLRTFDFSSLTNASGNTCDFALLNPPASLEDVSGTELCLQAKAGGHLQIGKNKVVGTMSLPLASATNRTAQMTLFRHETDEDGDVPIGYANDAATNLVTSALLTLEPREILLPLPDEATALFLQSRTTRRIRVRDVKILSDYVSGYATTNSVLTRHTSACASQIVDLPSGDYLWRVRSFDSENCSSPWSDFVSATLDAANPPCSVYGLLISIQ